MKWNTLISNLKNPFFRTSKPSLRSKSSVRISVSFGPGFSKKQLSCDMQNGGTLTHTYELTDHLGNVRAVVQRKNNTADVTTSADYYPFGWRMPDRVSIGGERYRFGYQGQFAEYDPETGYNHFEARLLDTRIGRWLTTDPAGQFFSPYVSMGNNPVNGVDPDGRLFGKLRAQIWTLFNGGTYEKLNGNWVAWGKNGEFKNFGGSWFKGKSPYAYVPDIQYSPDKLTADVYYVIELGGTTHSGVYYPKADKFIELSNPHESKFDALTAKEKEMGRFFDGERGLKAFETEKFIESGRTGDKIRGTLLFIPVSVNDVERAMNFHLKYANNSLFEYSLLFSNCKDFCIEGFLEGGNQAIYWMNVFDPVPKNFKGGEVEFIFPLK